MAGVHFSSSYGIKIGIWLGLIAAAALTYGGYLAMREEGASLRDPLGARSGSGADPSGAVPSQPEPRATGAVPAAAPAEQGGDAPAATPPLPPPAGSGDPAA